MHTDIGTINGKVKWWIESELTNGDLSIFRYVDTKNSRRKITRTISPLKFKKIKPLATKEKESINSIKSVEIKDLEEIVFTRNGIIVGKVQIMTTKDGKANVEFVGHSVNYGYAIQDTSLFHLDTNNKFWSGESIQIKAGA